MNNEESSLNILKYKDQIRTLDVHILKTDMNVIIHFFILVYCYTIQSSLLIVSPDVIQISYQF